MLLLLIAIEALALWHVLRQIKNCDQQTDGKLNFNFAALQDSPKTLLALEMSQLAIKEQPVPARKSIGNAQRGVW